MHSLENITYNDWAKSAKNFGAVNCLTRKSVVYAYTKARAVVSKFYSKI